MSRPCASWLSRRKATLHALLGGWLLAACGQSPPDAVEQVQPVGDMTHTMTWVLDPAADVIWGSAGFVVTEEGEQSLAPTTEEQWNRVYHAAAVVADGGNLLLMPHLVPAEGEGGAPTAAWVEFANGMTRIAGQAMQAAQDQDAEALFEIGGHLYNVCRACHQVFARDMAGDEAASDGDVATPQ